MSLANDRGIDHACSTNPRSQSEFRQLLAEVRQGSQNAECKLLQIYGPHVERVVHRMLGPHMRAKFDSTDFAQAVWLSFFRHRAEILDFSNAPQFVQFLARVARNKVNSELRRRLYTQKRNVRRERPLEDVDSKQLRGSDETPSHFLIACEEWDRLWASHPERDRAILRMKLLGQTNKAIAADLGLNERTIRRVMDRLLKTPPS